MFRPPPFLFRIRRAPKNCRRAATPPPARKAQWLPTATRRSRPPPLRPPALWAAGLIFFIRV
eukprot:322739-Prorocentrum_minimum.AAC.1